MSRNDLSDAGRWAPQALALLRITTAWQFLWHGSAKLFHVP